MLPGYQNSKAFTTPSTIASPFMDAGYASLTKSLKLYLLTPLSRRFLQYADLGNKLHTLFRKVAKTPGFIICIITIFSQSISSALYLGNTLDMQELRDIYQIACQRGSFPPLRSDLSAKSGFARDIQRDLPGYKLFKTHSGLMGLCPSWASKADIIIVAFGCDTPLILRRTERTRYQMGGKCSVNGKMLGEAILSPLSAGCCIVNMEVAGNLRPVFVDANGVPTQLDLRVRSLPSGWSVWYGTDRQTKMEIENGKRREQWFFHEETGNGLSMIRN